jgi:hypothetical protein
VTPRRSLRKLGKAIVIGAAFVLIGARLMGKSDALFSHIPDLLLAAGITALGLTCTMIYIRRAPTEREVRNANVGVLGELLSRLNPPVFRVVMIAMGIGITALGIIGLAASFF